MNFISCVVLLVLYSGTEKMPNFREICQFKTVGKLSHSSGIAVTINAGLSAHFNQLCAVTNLIDFGWRVKFVLLQSHISGFVRCHMVLRSSCCSVGGAGEGAAALGISIFSPSAVQQMGCGVLLAGLWAELCAQSSCSHFTAWSQVFQHLPALHAAALTVLFKLTSPLSSSGS